MNKFIKKILPVLAKWSHRWASLYTIATLTIVLLGLDGHVAWQKFYGRDVDEAAASLNPQGAL